MHVTHDLGVGGLPRVVQALCTATDPDRFEVSVLCTRGKGPFAETLETRGIRVYELERPAERPDYFPFRRIAAVLSRNGIDVVHTHNTDPFVGGAIGAALARTPTLIHTDHARTFPDKVRYMVAEHFLAYRAYRVVGVSEDTTEKLHRYERIPRHKLMTIPNGIDLSPFDRLPPNDEARAALGIVGDGPVIGFSSRIEEQKGIPYLLEAMVRVRTAFPSVKLILAGEGSRRTELEEKVRQLELDDHVRFVGVVMDVPRFLAAVDVYVLPSIWEGLPMALLEAMAAGCPVVASAVGGIPTAVAHEVTGALVDPQQPEPLARELERLLGDPDLRRRLGAEARRVCYERFSASAMAAQYEALYARQGP